MVIIVEGPDGSGKSTLVNQLLKSIPGSKTVHFGAPNNDEEANNYWQVYAKAIYSAAENEVVIFDRSWYSDMVYGPVMRGKAEMSDMHANMLDSLVIARAGGGMILFCTAPVSTLWSRCKKRGEAYVPSKECLAELAKTYNEVMLTKPMLPVIRYDTNAPWV